MRNSVWSLPFDASTDLVARRKLAAGDASLSPGDAVPESVFSPRRLRQLFDQRVIVHRVTYDALVNGVARFTVESADEPLPEQSPVEPVVPEQIPVEPIVSGLPGLPGLPGAENSTPEKAPESESQVDADLEKLRVDAKELGIEVESEWDAVRLHSEIDKVLENGKSA